MLRWGPIGAVVYFRVPKDCSVSTLGKEVLQRTCEKRCIAVRKRMTLSAQKLKMRCVALSHAAAVNWKLNVMSKLIAIDLYQSRNYQWSLSLLVLRRSRWEARSLNTMFRSNSMSIFSCGILEGSAAGFKEIYNGEENIYRTWEWLHRKIEVPELV